MKVWKSRFWEYTDTGETRINPKEVIKINSIRLNDDKSLDLTIQYALGGGYCKVSLPDWAGGNTLTIKGSDELNVLEKLFHAVLDRRIRIHLPKKTKENINKMRAAHNREPGTTRGEARMMIRNIFQNVCLVGLATNKHQWTTLTRLAE